jgi:HNH endonuclease
MAAKPRKGAEYSEAEARYAEQLKDPNVRVIRLTKGQVSIVDASEYERHGTSNWSATGGRGTKGYYAVRVVGGRLVYLHCEIMGFRPGQSGKGHKLVVDHKNGDTCDNRRCNLQLIRKSKDCLKRKTPITNTTGCRGIGRVKRTKGYAYTARITIKGRRKSLGTFATYKMAVAARRKAVRRTRDPHQREYTLNWLTLLTTILLAVKIVLSLPEVNSVVHHIK